MKNLKMFNMTLVELAKEELSKKPNDNVKDVIRKSFKDEFQGQVLEFIKKFISGYNTKAVTYLQFVTMAGLTSPAFDSYLDMLDSVEIDEEYLKTSWESITEEFCREAQEVINMLTENSAYIKVEALVQFEPNDINIMVPIIRLVLKRK